MIEKTLHEILSNTRFITIATICEDGSPYATPLGWWAFDFSRSEIVFDCCIGTTHHANLVRDGRCFITIVNYDTGHGRAVYVSSSAGKLSGSEYEKAKELILSKNLQVDDDIFAAPFGEFNVQKSRIRDGESPRFYYYSRYEKETK